MISKILFSIAALLAVSETYYFSAPGTNPYCGTTGSEFAQPTVVCPPDRDYELDESCVASCYNTYQAAMVAAYNTACSQWNDAAAVYDQCAFSAMGTYDSCMASATTFQQKNACKFALLSAIDTCANNFTAAKHSVVNSLNATVASNKVDFQSCASACCVPSEQ
jgi:hypothetical protein